MVTNIKKILKKEQKGAVWTVHFPPLSRHIIVHNINMCPLGVQIRLQNQHAAISRSAVGSLAKCVNGRWHTRTHRFSESEKARQIGKLDKMGWQMCFRSPLGRWSKYCRGSRQNSPNAINLVQKSKSCCSRLKNSSCSSTLAIAKLHQPLYMHYMHVDSKKLSCGNLLDFNANARLMQSLLKTQQQMLKAAVFTACSVTLQVV